MFRLQLWTDINRFIPVCRNNFSSKNAMLVLLASCSYKQRFAFWYFVLNKLYGHYHD